VVSSQAKADYSTVVITTPERLIKNLCQIEHSRHRSPINFCVHLLTGLAAYCHQPKKPSLRLDLHPLSAA
jgi:hypothetical protein